VSLFILGDGVKRLRALRRELRAAVMSLQRQTRRGREYLDFYERSEIKSLVTRDRLPPSPHKEKLPDGSFFFCKENRESKLLCFCYTYANGKTIWSKGKMKDGHPNGYWEWYRLDGTVKRSGNFKEGVSVGEWITYDAEGKKYKVTQK
jgi:hypothetical protein